MEVQILIVALALIAVGLYKNQDFNLGNKKKKEKFHRRISNLQPLPDVTSDQKTWQRQQSYYKDHPNEYSNLNIKPPEVKGDFHHTNEVPFFKSEPYYVYKDETHPFLDRYTGDRPKKETIPPLYEHGKTYDFNRNDITLERLRAEEQMAPYKNNFHAHNSKNFEYVGGDPLRVGKGIAKGYSAEPSGGFHQMWRPKEYTYEEITGETRPNFDDAVRIPGLKGSKQIPLEKIKRTRPAKVIKTSSTRFKQPAAYTKATAHPEVIVKQQKTLDAPMYPYKGPAYGSVYGNRPGDLFNDNIEPKPVKWDPSTTMGEVNYYHPTSDPGFYKREKTHYGSRKDKGKHMEKYANYKLVDTRTQRHIYKDYNDYEWNDMKNGNDYVCVTRRENVSALKGFGGKMDAEHNILVKQNRTAYSINKYKGGVNNSKRGITVESYDTSKAPNKSKYIKNKRKNVDNVKTKTYIQGDHTTDSPNKNDYIRNKYVAGVETKGASDGYKNVEMVHKVPHKGNISKGYFGVGGNSSGERNRDDIQSIRFKSNRNKTFKKLSEIDTNGNPLIKKATERGKQIGTLKKKVALYRGFKHSEFNIKKSGVDNRNITKYNTKKSNKIVSNRTMIRPKIKLFD